MKTKFLLLMMLCFSVTMYSQTTGMKTFTSQDENVTWQDFKKTNKVLKTEKKSSDVVTLEVDGSTIDEDYKKITWVFISDRIMNCVVEFNEDQTFVSLSKKYGKGTKTASGYEWYGDNGRVQIIFTDTRANEVMIIYGIKQYAYTPGQ